MSATAWVVIVGVGVALYGGVLVWGFLQAKHNYPRWIVPQLRGGRTVRVSVGNAGGTWNPAKPGVGGRVFASGRATYTLDEGGVVHLLVQPKRGADQHFSGPLPDTFEGTPAGIEKARRLFRVVVAGYVVALGVGFVVGYLISTGTTGARLLWGLLGLVVAGLCVWFGALVFRVALSVKSIRSDKG